MNTSIHRAPDLRLQTELHRIGEECLRRRRRATVWRFGPNHMSNALASLTVDDDAVVVTIKGSAVRLPRHQVRRLLREKAESESEELAATGWKPVGHGWWRRNDGPSVSRGEALRFARKEAVHG